MRLLTRTSGPPPFGGRTPRSSSQGRFSVSHSARVGILGIALGIVVVILSLVPDGLFTGLSGHAAAHALLVRSTPTSNAILKTPPATVHLWFSEDLNALSSRALVVDTTNREVDRKDSHLTSGDPREMVVSLPLLAAGTYVVVWRAQSTDDGHITGGSFIFRVARPDGTVPPVPSVLPTGHVPGAGGVGGSSSGQLDGPTILQAVSTWLALVFLAFWVGGVLWETWILGPGLSRDPDLNLVATASARRFTRLAPLALTGILVADIGIVLGQSAELAGDWSGAISGTLLRAVLFGSQFGTFWWMRQFCALAALGLVLAANRYGWPRSFDATKSGDATLDSRALQGSDEPAFVPDWRRELVRVLRDIPHVPRHLIAGLKHRTRRGLLDLVLAVALIVAFALSGHAAAVPSTEFVYAISVDLLHLLANATWVGGLFYISMVLVPELQGLSPRLRFRVLARGLPHFSAVAIISAGLLAATGSLNTSIHLTSISQFVTTTYGVVLAVKIELFLAMVAISVYHAFHVRPLLAAFLQRTAPAAQTSTTAIELTTVAHAESVGTRGRGTPERSDIPDTDNADTPQGQLPETLAGRLENWLRREAELGVGVLLCVALLAAFAGTLSPVAGSGSQAASGPFKQTQVVGGYHVALTVSPAGFGTNTFTVVLTDDKGKPVNGASIVLETNMLDMDMGLQTAQLKPTGAAGTYEAQSDLTMAGHWDALFKILPPHAKQHVKADFHFTAST